MNKRISLPVIKALLLLSSMEPAFSQNPQTSAGSGLPQADARQAKPDLKGLLRRGRNLLDQKQLDAALQSFSEYINIKQQDPEGFFWLGVTLCEMKQFEKAERAFRTSLSRAEKMGMDSPETLTNLANVQLEQNKVDEAIETYKRVLIVDSQLATAYLNLARAQIQKGEAQNALENLSVCEELKYGGPQLPYYRAKALKLLGRTDEAQAMVKLMLMRVPEGAKERTALLNEFPDPSLQAPATSPRHQERSNPETHSKSD